jgi:nucleotide-binding universal stress UspA family protein
MEPEMADVTSSTAAAEATATGLSPFDRLLVPVDFSSASRAAYQLAMRIAERWGSEVILFNAAGPDGNDEFLRYTGVPWGKDDVVSETDEHLRRFADAIVPGSGARVRIDAARDDNSVRAVARACATHRPSLVVLGTHPHDRRRLLRSRAERIVRALDCPVVIVRGEPEARVDPDM